MATTTGTLTDRISSTVSSPTVNYSASYTATRASETASEVSVKLNFSAWLNSSQSRLGTGIKLTVFARVNGGNWHSAVLKQSSASWSGTAKHSASLTISADLKTSTAKIEFYVSRTGSSYSGTAGILGSAGNPKSYAAALPAYSGGNTGGDVPPTPGRDKHVLYVNVGGVWKRAEPYVNVNGAWKSVIPYAKSNGVWKSQFRK